jgi:hypothetical protein
MMKPEDPLSGRLPCPVREKLTAYAAGRLSLAELESVAEHVTSCPSCTAALEAVPDMDPLVSNLRGCQDDDPLLAESGCRRLEARARALGTDLTVDTPGLSPHECTTAIAPVDEGLPTPFGKYTLLAKLGEGGMGVVYKAQEATLRRVVALKMLPTGVLNRPQEAARFFREAQAVSQVTHPNIVALHEYGEHGGRPFFTMDFAEKGSLSSHRQQFADPGRAAALMEKIARAIHHAHGKGILHRDLKPGNILLGADGEPRVSDFGLAKFLDSDEELTQKGLVVGTPAYMSPEQAAGQGEPLTPRSDVWSLGVILYELLTEQRPFRGGRGKQMARAIQTDDPPLPRELKPQLCRDLEAVVLKCLEKEPARRYRSAEELADDLGRWRRGEATSARPEGLWGRTWRTLRRSRVSRVAAFVLAALFLVLVGGGLALYSRSMKTARANEEERQRRQQALEAVERDLKAGKEVALVGKKGLPRWWRWAAGGEEGALLVPDKMGELDVETHHLGLVELLPDPQQERYRVTAEVGRVGTVAGEVGVYILGEERTAERGLEHYFYALTFTEGGRIPARAFLKLFRHREEANDQTLETNNLKIQEIPLPL